jgi:hypothetical protein
MGGAVEKDRASYWINVEKGWKSAHLVTREALCVYMDKEAS